MSCFKFHTLIAFEGRMLVCLFVCLFNLFHVTFIIDNYGLNRAKEKDNCVEYLTSQKHRCVQFTLTSSNCCQEIKISEG